VTQTAYCRTSKIALMKAQNLAFVDQVDGADAQRS